MNVGPRDRRSRVSLLLSLTLVGVGCASGVIPDKAIVGDNLGQNGTGSQTMSGADGSVSDDATQPTGDASSGGPAPGDDSGSGSDGAAATDDGGGSTGGFTYAPSNFDPTTYSAPSGATTDCNATYSSTSHTFTTGSCSGTAPTIESGVAVSGGPAVDILVFSTLTIAASSTLTLTGSNPVILAVYGTATINGTIDASASGATPGAGGNATQCAAAKPGTGGINGASGGGGGGKAVAGGAGACGGQNCNSPDTIAGGAVTASSVFSGGCAGGVGQGSFATNGKPTVPAGAGGGAVQIAASGAVSGSGTLKANGTDGTAGVISTNGVGDQNGTGGGGGGSGGYILIEGTQTTAPSFTYAANGGAGGASSYPGGTAGTTNGAAQVAPGDSSTSASVINKCGGGGGGAYGYVIVHQE
ncbi:MAG: hypothetical protein ACRENE_31180 [Polyangiaceae bacterium]